MKAKELREKSVEELNAELLNLLREQFNLRMQDVARVKTLLNEKAGA